MRAQRSRTRDAAVVYLVLRCVDELLLSVVWTSAAVYFITDAQLDPLQLVLLGTGMELAILVFETPTGVVADAVSRRRSVLIGTALMGISFLMTGAVASFPVILAAQALWGLGHTFTSGATEAWAAGEVGDDRVGALILRGTQYATVAAAAGILLSIALANLGLRVPILVGGVAQLALAGWLTRVMPETGFTPVPRAERSSWRHFARTAGEGLTAARRSRVLVSLLVVALFAGMSTEGIDRLWKLQLLEGVGLPGGLSPVAWLGLVQLVPLGLAATVLAQARRRVDTGDPRLVCLLLLVLTVIEGVMLVTFGLAGGFTLAVAAFLTYDSVRGLREPLASAWIVPMIQPPRLRATVLSTVGQADAVGQVLGGPAIGLLATMTTPAVAIVAAGAALAPVAAVLARLWRRAPSAGRRVPSGARGARRAPRS
jgi:DHA3 family tetracycline resistance protein-like MFS transporter